MNLLFLLEAQQEFDEGIGYYTKIQHKLGQQFYQEVMVAIQKASEQPFAYQTMSPRVRRVLTHKFAYGVLYFVRQDALVVVAIMHLRQEPNYWRKRVDVIS
jgi:plasmid stabilization system protein ParE